MDPNAQPTAQPTAPAQGTPTPPANGAPPPSDATAAPAKPERDPAEVFQKALEMDRKVQADRAAIKAEREKFESERKKIEQEAAEARRLRKLLKEDPLGFLDAADMSFDQFQEALQRGRQLDPRVEELSEKLSKIEEAEQRRAQEREQAELASKRDAAINDFRQSVTSSEKHGLTAHYFEHDPQSATGLLEDTVQHLHTELGRIPSNEEAADHIERMLVEDTKARLSIPAVRSLVRQLIAEEEAGGGTHRDDPNQQAQHAIQGAATGDGPPTLTNHHAAQPGPRGARPLSRRERLSRLVEAAKKDGLGY